MFVKENGGFLLSGDMDFFYKTGNPKIIPRRNEMSQCVQFVLKYLRSTAFLVGRMKRFVKENYISAVRPIIGFSWDLWVVGQRISDRSPTTGQPRFPNNWVVYLKKHKQTEQASFYRVQVLSCDSNPISHERVIQDTHTSIFHLYN